VLLVLRLAFAALLYLFLFSLVAVIRRDLRRPAVVAPSSAAAGGAPPGDYLVVVAGEAGGLKAGAHLPLQPLTLVGRAADCQLRLADSFVSAHHARLRRREDGWYLEDLGSTNGTLLNQQPLEGEARLGYGDVIGIGQLRLKLAR
jgi:hypothetical protein